MKDSVHNALGLLFLEVIMREGDMLVDFYTYCKTCGYRDTIETEAPCNECLEQPTNEYTTRPVMWKENETKKR